MTKQPIIFCDFDGTITNNDNIIAIMKKFAPSQWEKLKDDVLSQRISIKEGVGNMFSLLPTNWKQEITEYVISQAEIRPGFEEFVAYTREKDIKLLIVSGGIDFFVNPLLQPFNIDRADIYCNGSDFSAERIKITWPNTCDRFCNNDCGCCKPSILRNYQADEYERIVIGDSITDLQAAKRADSVIARDFLIEKCRALGLNYKPFETFYDVIEIINQRQGELEGA
ncbi:2-hydroxy-3-keto-5-methylthiopentenyl-1-phosphate phosphatase [Pseudalkalibacillus decolorationis]|uniref:2-hydroxy-3-keto-5-methylthiopentenyl-1- phosphate phosphatase n=1 Tax=Pseudalkalibacillus decolorationis TaxID=163879 RepID=UPI00214879FB|nr:2-hydroxy-3-keto-5-methylthiopentenyl-1-phosphate phosphatase [Pseudalkalibacillus decolorationis]